MEMITELRELKVIRSDRVVEAFLAPRHLFVAREPLEKAYAANIPQSPRRTEYSVAV